MSKTCKELSRDRGAMYYIVSTSIDPNQIEHHTNRIGYHFRQQVVEEARKILRAKGHPDANCKTRQRGDPEPIPRTQREINQEADAVLRDLFPRIPNTDRHEIISHAFKKDGKFRGEYKVGMAKDLTLARRVQLAALAHIRHTCTRYDQLLKETDWANARKAVEKPCLDIIVKWRGDEETGRDQLDEILREVVVISEDEGSDDDDNEDETETDSTDSEDIRIVDARPAASNTHPQTLMRAPLPYTPRLVTNGYRDPVQPVTTPPRHRIVTRGEKRTVRRTQQRFKRYAAAAEALAGSGHPDHLHGHNSGMSAFSPINLTRDHDFARRDVPDRGQVIVIDHTPPRGHLQGRFERPEIPVFSRAPAGETTSAMYERPNEYHARRPPGQIIHVADSYTQRPKVGPVPALHRPEHISQSPVRAGLQDMLLPSIEPASPGTVRDSRVTPQHPPHEHRQFVEVSRGIPHTIPAPTVPTERQRFDEIRGSSAAPRRGVPYSDEDLEERPNKFIRIRPQVHEQANRQGPLGHLHGHPPGTTRLPEHERVVTRNDTWAVPRDDISLPRRDDGQSRMMAPPAMFNGNHAGTADQQPRRVIEVRGPPVYEIDEFASRREEVPGRYRQEPHHVQHTPRVVYANEPIPMARGFFDHGEHRVRPGGEPTQHFEPRGYPPVQQTQHHLTEPFSRPLGQLGDAGDPRQGHPPNVWPEKAPRWVSIDPRQPEPPAIRYEANNQFRDPVHMGDAGRPREVHYEQDYRRPFPVHPAPANYAENPPRYQIPERREVVWVDR
ncbi:hypothetical protein F4780DRAFT_218922 [Xylariomycetidae sp. FL0641]|nr:hypothetical protein F4780DRAFT_218922 [Xylariomycetidae sp. FL0641]